MSPPISPVLHLRTLSPDAIHRTATISRFLLLVIVIPTAHQILSPHTKKYSRPTRHRCNSLDNFRPLKQITPICYSCPTPLDSLFWQLSHVLILHLRALSAHLLPFRQIALRNTAQLYDNDLTVYQGFPHNPRPFRRNIPLIAPVPKLLTTLGPSDEILLRHPASLIQYYMRFILYVCIISYALCKFFT